MIVKVKERKPRIWMPQKRADVFQDRRNRRERTRREQERQAIKEYEELLRK